MKIRNVLFLLVALFLVLFLGNMGAKATPTTGFDPASLQAGRVGQPYYVTINYSGDFGPYAFSLYSGSLPDGLSLSEVGVISGQPTTSVAASFTIRAVGTDAEGYNQDYTLWIYPNPPFTYSPDPAQEGDTVTFTTVPGYTSYNWIVGNAEETCDIHPHNLGNANTAEYQFAQSGEYQVCLQYDVGGTIGVVSDNAYVSISNLPPDVTNLGVSDEPSLLGQEVYSGGYAVDAPGDGPFQCEIDWGDGTDHETTVSSGPGYCGFGPHAYLTGGLFDITIWATDVDGATGYSTIMDHEVVHVIADPGTEALASNVDLTTVPIIGLAPAGTTSLNFAITASPSHGSLSAPTFVECGPYGAPGVVACRATVVYTPTDTDPLYVGADSFSFTVSDDTHTSSEASPSLWVDANTAPTAQDGSATVSSVNPVYIALTASDPDYHESLTDRLTFIIDSAPSNGTLGPVELGDCSSGDAGITCTRYVLYTPKSGTRASTDSFTFHVNDAHQNSNMATVSLTLHAPATLHVNASVDLVEINGCNRSHCSLREAVEAAQTGDTIDFAPGLPTIVLAGSEILINKDITISGPGADLLAISGGATTDPTDTDHDRVFEFYDNGRPLTASLEGLTIKDGRASEGGGILVGTGAIVSVSDSVIGPNNIVTYAGGGISNEDGTLTLNRCAVVGNHGTGTEGGAGIYSVGSGSMTLINSTVSGNVTNNFGGGILAAYGSKVNLIHSTVSGNTANANATTKYEEKGGGGGIYIMWGDVTLQNSIVAGNTDMTEPELAGHAKWPDIFGAFTSAGGNLIGDGTGATGGEAGDQVGIDPMLDVLAVNAPGQTHTYALLADSPALDVVTCPAGITTDQRGVARPQGTNCDIGAYELLVLPKFYISGISLSLNAGRTTDNLTGLVTIYTKSSPDTPLSKVTVTGKWYYYQESVWTSYPSRSSTIVNTNRSGEAKFVNRGAPKAESWMLCVTGLEKAGYEFDPFFNNYVVEHEDPSGTTNYCGRYPPPPL